MLGALFPPNGRYALLVALLAFPGFVHLRQ